ncbi:uncharacterized protein CANTADRAFT_25584 [Suhomyces tanzawaensis NRRL Y-17324]|uniref:DUF1279 domain-containing protein n=1 Tax=Suhomyces tanzawaensis NRRL Y-17324 TaxID=984487 RepID=A0A1E4SJJ8_9ASCO|nr:uncharacterized protein CANTADRAFT_25584 [Suhomyces tanzawaensis NRRL Y-17324]ODV79681.1 hypothetical protein CANTADRAFT_25584 [Suhomyces tanzawaensis NRRL Y-17324]
MLRFNPLKFLSKWSIPPSRIITRRFQLKQQFFKRFQSIKTNGAQTTPPPTGSNKKPTGLKALMKEYGYSAFGVYMALSAIDLPLCYILVHSMGQDEIEYYENKVKQQFGYGMTEEELKKKQEIKRIEAQVEEENSPTPSSKSQGGFVQTVLSQFSWTEFAIAYGIHKSLIFIRVPICAAITPGVVKLLRRWGFKIGTDKLSTSATLAKDTLKDLTASSTKFGTKPNAKKKWFSWFF